MSPQPVRFSRIISGLRWFFFVALIALLRTSIRVLALHLYWLLFVFLISVLPVLVQFSPALQPYFLGLYRDLIPLDLFLVSLVGGIAVWSLMITQALLIDGVEARFLIANKQSNAPGIKAFGQDPKAEYHLLPGWLERLLNWPLTWSQIGLYFLLAMPGLFTVIWYSQTDWLSALLAAATGILLAFGIMFGLTFPAFLVEGSSLLFMASSFKADKPKVFTVGEFPDVTVVAAVRTDEPVDGIAFLETLRKYYADRQTGIMASLRTLFSRLCNLLSNFSSWLHMDYLLDERIDAKGQRQRVLAASHFWASIVLLVLLVLYFGVRPLLGWALPQLTNYELPAVVHLLVLITLLIWLVQLAEFHLSLLRVPAYLCLLVLVVGFQGLRGSDYFFAVQQRETPLTTTLTPIEVVTASKDSDNLVVVTSTGGGILAAGWTTKVLQELITKRPKLAHEIRLISAASGGSVGAAFYIDELRRQFSNGTDCHLTADLLKEVHQKSVKSSLGAVAYGFSFIDFWTILFGGPVLAETDRGRLLEEKWAKNANGTPDAKAFLLRDFEDGIRTGCIPAPILNTTVMENGQRVMITPIDFTTAGATAGKKRAMTLAEYLFTNDSEQPPVDVRDKLDISLWTAARLSATFPYISPAVRADLSKTDLAQRQDPFLGHHFVDGGYHDNYGVASALDWLNIVLDARRQTNADSPVQFKRVLIIQLRVSPTGDSRQKPAEKGYRAAFFGPLIGLFQIRDGAAYARNEVELDRFISSWNDRLRTRVKIATAILEPTSDPTTDSQALEAAPLSWHLTHAQIEALHNKVWEPCLTEIDHFLDDKPNTIEVACAGGKRK